jgi:hypothetical protein
MNIFVLDPDPARAAHYLCDKHVVKMALETAQLLCTALALRGATDLPYRPTHRHHPCTLWTATSRPNFDWLVEHGQSICREYRLRYNGREHASQRIIDGMMWQLDWLPSGPATPFAQAMPDQYRTADDAVAAYRAYYIGEKARFAKWRLPAKPPAWWPSDLAAKLN